MNLFISSLIHVSFTSSLLYSALRCTLHFFFSQICYTHFRIYTAYFSHKKTLIPSPTTSQNPFLSQNNRSEGRGKRRPRIALRQWVFLSCASPFVLLDPETPHIQICKLPPPPSSWSFSFLYTIPPSKARAQTCLPQVTDPPKEGGARPPPWPRWRWSVRSARRSPPWSRVSSPSRRWVWIRPLFLWRAGGESAIVLVNRVENFFFVLFFGRWIAVFDFSEEWGIC